jgi:hypothetical protein
MSRQAHDSLLIGDGGAEPIKNPHIDCDARDVVGEHNTGSSANTHAGRKGLKLLSAMQVLIVNIENAELVEQITNLDPSKPHFQLLLCGRP